MESVIWAFKQLWDKGLIYKAYRVMPYSWGAETPLSNFEIRLDDATRPRQDPALTVAFRLHPAEGDPGPLSILVWTTTPWTLPSNLALAVGPDITYVVLREPGTDQHYLLADSTLAKYEAQVGGLRAGRHRAGPRARGADLRPAVPVLRRPPEQLPGAGRRLRRHRGGHRGPSTWRPASARRTRSSASAKGIALVVPVDDAGRFTAEVPDWEGENVFDANPDIIKALKERGVVVRHDSYEHNYPHCWRTDTPIIYKAVDSWFVEVTKFKDRLVAPQPGHQLDPRARPRRPVRPLAGRGPGLVDQPQPLLGLTDPHLGVGRPRPPAHRRVREPRRDRGRLRGAPRRPAPTDGRRAGPPQPRRPDRDLDDAAGPRGPGLLVRLGLDALRPGPLPVREPGVVRGALPRRLHRRVHRPDPWLVLHAARVGHRSVRQPPVRERDLPRHPAGRGRTEDLQAAAQLPGTGPGLRHPRLGRVALVLHVLADPAGPRPGDRPGGHQDRRGGAHRAAPALVRVPLLHPLRERRRPPGDVPDRRHRHPGPLRPGQDPRPGRGHHPADGRLRPGRCLRGGRRLLGRPQQLVHPPLAATASGPPPRPRPSRPRPTRTTRSTRCWSR